MTPATDHELLASIDAKLSALLTLTLDSYLRDTGTAKPKERSVDAMLAGVGLTPQQIAALLGKTDRAVRMQLEDKPTAKKTAKTTRVAKGGP
jgi:hypothetical protein